MPKKTLTPKIQLFVDEFLKDVNGTQASIRAGYSERSAMQQAYDLLRKPEVAELVEAPKAELIEKSQMTLEKWVKLVTALAFYDLRKLLDKFGNPIEIPELDELHAMAVAGFEHVEEFEGRGEARLQTGWTRKVKLLDRTPYVPCSGNITMRFPSPSSRLCSRLRPIRARTCRSSRKKNGTSTNEFGRRRC